MKFRFLKGKNSIKRCQQWKFWRWKVNNWGIWMCNCQMRLQTQKFFIINDGFFYVNYKCSPILSPIGYIRKTTFLQCPVFTPICTVNFNSKWRKPLKRNIFICNFKIQERLLQENHWNTVKYSWNTRTIQIFIN